jgi:hypothetical protein
MHPDVRPLPILRSERRSYSFSSSTDERGNRILIIICSLNVLLLYPGTKAYYVWRNRQRVQIWDGMTPEASPWRVTERRG